MKKHAITIKLQSQKILFDVLKYNHIKLEVFKKLDEIQILWLIQNGEIWINIRKH